VPNLKRNTAKKNLVNLAIKDAALLYQYYMPFLKNGGLFLAGLTEYELGDEVFILLELMDEAERIPVAGEVVWIARNGVKNPHKPGSGVNFIDADNEAKDKIEKYLAGSKKSQSVTATM
jgi:type IV pilus assembly protein PilZ